jgi:hypothetical protein
VKTRGPKTPKQLAADVLVLLRPLTLVRPETEQALLVIIAAAGQQVHALGLQGIPGMMALLLAAAKQIADASTELVINRSRPEDFDEFFAELHRRLVVHEVPALRNESAG